MIKWITSARLSKTVKNASGKSTARTASANFENTLGDGTTKPVSSKVPIKRAPVSENFLNATKNSSMICSRQKMFSMNNITLSGKQFEPRTIGKWRLFKNSGISDDVFKNVLMKIERFKSPESRNCWKNSENI